MKVINELNTSEVKRCKIPGWPNVGAQESTLEAVKLALGTLHPQNLQLETATRKWELLPSCIHPFISPTLMYLVM